MRLKIGFWSVGIAVVLIILVLSLTVSSCGKKRYAFISGTTQMMGTEVNITIYPYDEEADSQYFYNRTLETIEEVADIAAAFRQESELYALNQSAGAVGGYTVSYTLMDILVKSREAYELTGGAFDPTVAPLVFAYGFDYHPATGEESKPHSLTDEELEKLLPLVGYDKVLLDEEGGVVFLPSGMNIDLGAIAKGYAADLACDGIYYSVKGVMVDIGGDISIRGRKPSGDPWLVAIADPRDPEKTLAELALTGDCGVATSGDYERYFEVDDERYSHIIDPRTGLPARWVVSTTVIAPTATLADALTTAVFVLGVSEGIALIDQLADTEVIIYTEESGELIAHYSVGAEELLVVDEEE